MWSYCVLSFIYGVVKIKVWSDTVVLLLGCTYPEEIMKTICPKIYL